MSPDLKWYCRTSASFDASATQAAKLGTVQFTVELWGFGTPVDVTAPPADQVTDATGATVFAHSASGWQRLSLPVSGRVVRMICPPAPGAKDWEPSAYSPTAIRTLP